MMVENNSFDLWKNDSFFSAAEEVQESTDRYVILILFYFFTCLRLVFVLDSFVNCLFHLYL